MEENVFYRNNRMSIRLEHCIDRYDTFEEFEKQFSEEFLNADNQVGDYLADLLWKYDKKASVVSLDAGQSTGYVGNIINNVSKNPSRDVLICICFAIGTTFDEVQYLLKYAGHAPLYVRNKRDVIIWFGIMKKESLDVVNDNLEARGFKPLYVEK